MTPEDRLRDHLREQASTIVPAGDGLAKIQQRVARRRRRRVLLVPGAALATTGAALAIFLLGSGGSPTTLTVEPPAGASSNPTPSATPVPSATVAVPVYDGPAVWPFTSPAQASAWTAGGSYPWAESKKDVIKNFLLGHLKLTTLQAGFELQETGAATCTGCEVLELVTVDNRKAATVTVAGFQTAGGKRVFTVVGVDGGDLTVTTPAVGAAVTSPLGVGGRITGVHENVLLRLVTTSGSQLAQTSAPAGSEAPWQGTLSWSDTGWTSAAIVGTTGSDKDGSLTRLVVVPVTRGSAAAPSFVGLVDGHVSLFDATTGKVVRQLTFPPAGARDTWAAWSAGRLAWVRHRETGCADELNRLDKGASTIVPAGTAHLSSPQLSPTGNWLGWVQIPCAGGDASIVVSGGGAPERVLAVPSGTSATLLDVREDGALLVHLNDAAGGNAGTIGLVPPGALNLDGITALTPSGSCYFTSAAAFDGTGPVAFETCLSDGRLVRFDATGRRTSADPPIAHLEAPSSVSVSNGAVLVRLFGGDSVGEIARYLDGAFSVIVKNTGCTSVGEPKGCVRAPDW